MTTDMHTSHRAGLFIRQFAYIPICFLLLLCSLPSMAQVKFGFRGGLNLVDFSIKNYQTTFDKANRAGYFFGPVMKISLPSLPVGIDLALIYDEKTAEVDGLTATHKTINIPLNARFSVGFGSSFNVFAFGGPQYTFNRSDDKLYYSGTDFQSEVSSYKDWSWRSSYLSFNVGVGITLFEHVELRGNYSIACGRTASVTVYDAVKKTATDSFKSHYNAWQIATTVYF